MSENKELSEKDEPLLIDKIRNRRLFNKRTQAQNILQGVVWKSYEIEIEFDDSWIYKTIGEGQYGCVLSLLRKPEYKSRDCNLSSWKYFTICDRFVLKWQKVDMPYLGSYLTEIFLQKTLEEILPFAVPHFYGFYHYNPANIPFYLKNVIQKHCRSTQPSFKEDERQEEKQKNVFGKNENQTILYFAYFMSEGTLGSVKHFMKTLKKHQHHHQQQQQGKRNSPKILKPNIKSIIFQLLYNAAIFDEKISFQHRDININNILLEFADFYSSQQKSKLRRKTQSWEFCYNNTIFKVPVYYVPLLTDFGMSYLDGGANDSVFGTFGFFTIPALFHDAKLRPQFGSIDSWGYGIVLLCLAFQCNWIFELWQELETTILNNIRPSRTISNNDEFNKAVLEYTVTLQVILGNAPFPTLKLDLINYDFNHLTPIGKLFFVSPFKKELQTMVRLPKFGQFCQTKRNEILRSTNLGVNGLMLLSILCSWKIWKRPPKKEVLTTNSSSSSSSSSSSGGGSSGNDNDTIDGQNYRSLYGWILQKLSYFECYRNSPKSNTKSAKFPTKKFIQPNQMGQLPPELKAALFWKADVDPKNLFIQNQQKNQIIHLGLPSGNLIMSTLREWGKMGKMGKMGKIRMGKKGRRQRQNGQKNTTQNKNLYD